MAAVDAPALFLISTLVLDPDEGTRPMLAEAVGNRGHQVSVASGFEEAARLLARGSFDCLVLKLREAWAAQTTALLRQLPRGADGQTVHVVAVVLDDAPPRPEDWLQSGVDDCIIGQARGPHVEFRLAVAERAISARRSRHHRQQAALGGLRNFEHVFRLSPEPLLVVTAREGAVLEANEAACAFLAVPAGEMRERFLSLLMPGLLGREEMGRNWGESQNFLCLNDVPHRLPDGTERVLEVLMSRCQWAERPAMWVRLRDVTADRRAEDGRLRAARLDAVRSVASGAARALNDSLTAVRGNIDLLTKQNTPRADAHELLESAASACERAEETVRTLANIARSHHVGPRRKALDLRSFLERAIAYGALRSQLRPEFSLPEDLWAIEADEVPLREAVLALVENADQAMPQGGVFRISASNVAAPSEGDAGSVAIEFTDAGEGIAPGHRARLFDPYFTTRAGRQGLGLSRVMAIVSAHGGSMEVESAPGHGATFRLILPAATQPAPTAVETAASKPFRGRVLVMDDDAGIRVIVEKMLTMQGFEVYAVRDGQEALVAYRRAKQMGSPFHVVLLDLDVRGGMGGRECIARLRGEFPGVRALLTTGYLDDTVLENHREHGFSGVVTKPFNVERLVSSVSRLAGVGG